MCPAAVLLRGCETAPDDNNPVEATQMTIVPEPLGWCEICPELQSFEESNESEPQCRQKCPEQERFQWIKDLIKGGCNQVWELEAKTYYIDRQYLLPCGVRIKGAGSGPGGTLIKAIRCEQPLADYGIGTEGVKYRIGFVLNHNTSISDLSFEGDDSTRYFKDGANGKDYSAEGYGNIEGEGAGLETETLNGTGWCKAGGNGFTDLQGGAGFETPGCSDPYACALTPCINGKFTTPACYMWDAVESIAVKNVLLENIVTTNTNVGFFGAPLNEHLGFDLANHRPSNITVNNFRTPFSYADGMNIHGNFDGVTIDGYIVGEAGDDCIALWSHKSLLGEVSIQNSYAGSCGYMGCFAVYGGSGPLNYTNITCAAGTHPDWAWGSHHCLWLEDQFDGQFSPDAQRMMGSISIAAVGFAMAVPGARCALKTAQCNGEIVMEPTRTRHIFATWEIASSEIASESQSLKHKDCCSS
eukprot:CAMPEP_0197653802 /NCGR_PEP_ID=MMETSP1338-20131121/37182_1 /TAXON_ID=43686 ORGANISM="Pelagodinium beii, Strain RCC1491" /NCGR_SAMPLE_ID=MMETSP1338 /ASSEMBLY_ACC=CAM_ASM_000754 /LENGTH=469 /DNA_ID=CAMNT_0043229047 /DNA_START=78 /DNA_END=1484 /DNA_ORIENTATION=-